MVDYPPIANESTQVGSDSLDDLHDQPLWIEFDLLLLCHCLWSGGNHGPDDADGYSGGSEHLYVDNAGRSCICGEKGRKEKGLVGRLAGVAVGFGGVDGQLVSGYRLGFKPASLAAMP